MTNLADDGLARLHDSMAKHVDSGHVPGVVTLVACADDVHVDVVGKPAFDADAPLTRDAIFRIASLTKPITATTAMALVDDGLLRLDQPVDDVLPELADRRVLRAVDADLDDTVAAHRSITVEDLLTSRLGIGTVMAAPDSLPIQRAETALDLKSIGGPPWPPAAHDVDSWIGALGTLPLVHQPGKRWMYNTSMQVLGVLIARATQQPLATVMRERVFEPLGMRDTGFTVPATDLDRLTTAYAPDAETGALSILDDPRTDSWWSTPTTFPDASGWLVSTVDDYWTFVSMLLRGGAGRDGRRILTPASVALMTTDHLTATERGESVVFLDEHGGWGFGMGAHAHDELDHPLPCGIGWSGGTGTVWRTHLGTGVTGIALTQRAMTSPEPPALMEDFWSGVNAATVLT